MAQLCETRNRELSVSVHKSHHHRTDKATTTDIHPLHSSCSMWTWLNNFIARQPWIYNAIILCHSCCSHVKVLNQVPTSPLGDNRDDVVSMNLFIQTTTLSFHWNHKKSCKGSSIVHHHARVSPRPLILLSTMSSFLLSTMLFLWPINASLPAFYLNNPKLWILNNNASSSSSTAAVRTRLMIMMRTNLHNELLHVPLRIGFILFLFWFVLNILCIPAL